MDDNTREEQKQQFVNAMHNYFGIEEDGELAYFADIFDSVALPFFQSEITKAVDNYRDTLITNFEHDLIEAQEQLLDEFYRVNNSAHFPKSNVIPHRNYVNKFIEAKRKAIKEKTAVAVSKVDVDAIMQIIDEQPAEYKGKLQAQKEFMHETIRLARIDELTKITKWQGAMFEDDLRAYLNDRIDELKA